jgi:hypothetical protein
LRQELQLMMSLADKRGSKNSILPSSTLIAHCTAMVGRHAASTVGLPNSLDKHEAFWSSMRREREQPQRGAEREPEKDSRRALLGPHGYDAVTEGAEGRPPGAGRTE